MLINIFTGKIYLEKKKGLFTMQNQYPIYDVPPEIKKWNWGAFMFNIWWGIGNKSYLALLCLIPLANIVMPFVCGALGNEWAWKNGNYTSVDEFKKVQETWNRAGFVSFIVCLVFIVMYIIFIVFIVSLTASTVRHIR